MIKVMKLIDEYVETIDNGMPIFSSDIKDYILTQTTVDTLLINEYINRYYKKNDNFIRYKKGIYYKTIDTVFGKSTINYQAIIKRLYIKDKDDIYGYETGPSIFNNLGLTTQVPKYTFIATNKLQVDKLDNTLKLVKPVVRVNKDNYKYLQLLDIISNRFKVAIEANNYQEIIRDEIDRYSLNFETLLYYATFYKDKMIYKKIAQLARKPK